MINVFSVEGKVDNWYYNIMSYAHPSLHSPNSNDYHVCISNSFWYIYSKPDCTVIWNRTNQRISDTSIIYCTQILWSTHLISTSVYLRQYKYLKEPRKTQCTIRQRLYKQVLQNPDNFVLRDETVITKL